MRLVVHLSDLHFGRVDQAVLEPLVDAIREIAPHVVVVSGDLTQRARQSQFAEARDFLQTLPSPQIVVPGNHDVPLYNIFARFLQPLDNFKEYITKDLEPFYSDEEIAVLGINTARSFTFKQGRINEQQVERIRERMCGYPDEMTKIVVTHHPFDVPEGHTGDILGRARMAIEALARCDADVVLAGHLHISHTGHTAKRFNTRGHSALVVQAGTATSTRGRGEPNSFNLIRIQHPHINVERLSWRRDIGAFKPASSETFRHTSDGWIRLSDEVAAGIAFSDGSYGLQPRIP
jgi:3',5'-cyclic AMP phosphodiesterase CpdA